MPRLLATAALLALTALTVVDRGATRMYASPWYGIFRATSIAALGLLALRAASVRVPLRLPTLRWLLLAAGAAITVLVSALASPFRGPSLLAALTPIAAIAAFLLLHDWLAREPGNPARFLRTAGGASLLVVAASLGPWLTSVIRNRWWMDLTDLSARRNAHPLGHANYTAGLALLALPWLGTLAWRSTGPRRWGWATATLLALVMLVSSGSRAGIVGFAALLVVVLFHARPPWKLLVLGTLAAVALAAGLALINPRTRTLLLRRARAGVELSASQVQRRAMLTAGWRMGQARPLTGWGPGTTPLVYPRFRAGLDGGVETALQLHSTPVQLWADHGAPGMLVLLGFAVLVAHATFRRRGEPLVAAASAALAGYAGFALFDYELDVPVFAFAVAAATAALTAASPSAISVSPRRGLLLATLGALALIAGFGRRDPAPAMNVRALAIAATDRPAAIDLLRASLQRDDAQEIAHFNLGWLFVVDDPAEAERHFLAAARLVPDKGGVYLGLALARLNQRPDSTSPAAAALALECLNDPLFLTSPWWRTPEFIKLRPGAMERLQSDCERLARQLDARRDARAHDARWVAALANWLGRTDAPGEMLALARTPQRVRYFVDRPALPDFPAARVLVFRRERTAYPVLMRNLDLPPPRDLFDVQENALAAGELRFLFPAKGWLPAPLLRELLEPAVSAMP